MPAEIKIQCECGHSKLISKSNISAHRKSKTHAKNMAAIGTDEPQEFENTIICSEVKAAEPKVKAVKKTTVKKTKPVEEVVEIEEEVKQDEEATGEVIVTIEEVVTTTVKKTTKKVINTDKLKELQTVIGNCFNIIEELQEEIKRINTPILECIEEEEKVEPVEEVCELMNELITRIEEQDEKDYRFIVWTQSQYFVNRVIEEIKRRNHPIFKGIDEAEPVETIEEVTEIIEEVIKTIEEKEEEEVEILNELINEMITTIEEEEVEPDDKKINHKSINGSEWLEYIPDDDTHSTSVMEYITANLKIDKKIVEHLKVKFIYFDNKIQIQICASDIITDTPPIKLYQCNTYEEHFTGGNANAFKIYCDESIEYKCDFLKKKKYNTFRCSTFKKLVKREEAAENIFFKIEEEILKYSNEIQRAEKKNEKKKLTRRKN